MPQGGLIGFLNLETVHFSGRKFHFQQRSPNFLANLQQEE